MTRILVVDDDRNLLRALRINLTARGYQVQVATDAATGLAMATRLPPDLAIVDLGLPDMDGPPALARRPGAARRRVRGAGRQRTGRARGRRAGLAGRQRVPGRPGGGAAVARRSRRQVHGGVAAAVAVGTTVAQIRRELRSRARIQPLVAYLRDHPQPTHPVAAVETAEAGTDGHLVREGEGKWRT